jgi:hypothetical protein
MRRIFSFALVLLVSFPVLLRAGEASPVPHRLSVTVAPVYLFFSGIGVNAELVPLPHLGLALSGVHCTVEGHDAVGLTGQARYYPFRISHGFHVGAEAVRLGVETYRGWFAGILLGYKYVSAAGFTWETQAGPSFALQGTEEGLGPPQGQWFPRLNLNAGWSFR